MTKTTEQLIREAVLSEDKQYLYEIEFVGDDFQTYDIWVKSYEILGIRNNMYVLRFGKFGTILRHKRDGIDEDGFAKAYTTDENKIDEYKRLVADIAITYQEKLLEKSEVGTKWHRKLSKRYAEMREKLDEYRS